MSLTEAPPQTGEEPKPAWSMEREIGYLCAIKFHQIFTLPGTDNHGPLKVTYGIAGVSIGTEAPTIFCCQGMGATRSWARCDDRMATEMGIRVIYIDRPGFGGSTPVPLDRRISTFLEVVPALLKHLNIAHITLASHSAGTIYAFNLLATHPDLLDPTHPSVTFVAPWVHPSVTGNSWLTAAALLPNVLLSRAEGLMTVLFIRLIPKIRGLKHSLKNRKWKGDTSLERMEYSESLWVSEFEQKCDLAENTEGLNDEIRLCLKSVRGKCHWGAAEDYAEFAENCRHAWAARVANGEQKLAVNLVFAWEDAFIGEQGTRYFEECWSGHEESGMEVKIFCPPGTDHSSVYDSSRVTRAMFESAKNGTALRIGENSSVESVLGA